MNMRLVQQVIAGLVCFLFAFTLTGCGGLYSHQTEVRKLPDDVGAKLSIGDERQKVRSTLGTPLIDARGLGVEVYRNSGRDFDVGWVIAPWVPIPLVGGKVIAVVLVIYDENGLVKNFSTGIVERGSRTPDYSLWLTADDYVFTNTASMLPPDMLLGPEVTWEEALIKPPLNGHCELVLVMRHYCPMEQVLLDNEEIVNLSRAAVYCGFSPEYKTSFVAIIQKDIPSGFHQMNVSQISWPGDFDASFQCEPGERVYAELLAHIVLGKNYFEGTISISKNTPNNVFEVDRLRRILWHGGTWYGPVDNSVEVR
jgi:hypothetical protein